ncbi:MAG: hypothetical protein KDD33_12700 [Bdellovibrionales bacterium]|nr:hypothetical protein [Bdellovibrionales bacterium]
MRLVYFLGVLLLAWPLFSLEKNQKVRDKHGDELIVEYEIINPYKHVLKLKERTNMQASFAFIYKLLQTIDLKMKPGEHLSMDKGFDCQTRDKEYAYGVITETLAKPKGAFSPKRAWILKKKDKVIEKAVNPNAIDCEFTRTKKEYPYQYLEDE